jgi:hypothetical protein
MKLKLYFLAFLVCNVFFANAKSKLNPPNFSISYNTPGCIFAGNILPVTITDNNGSGVPIGVFSATPAGLTIDPNTGDVDAALSLPGNYTVKYTVSALVFRNTNLTLLNLITPTFNPIGNVCQNSIAPVLPTTSTNGVTGTWFPAVINTTTLGTISYTFTPNNFQCGQSIIISVTISTPTTTPVFNTLPTSYCINSIANVLPTTSSNGLVGSWNPSSINTSIAGSSTYIFTGNAQCVAPLNLIITINAQTIPDFSNIEILTNFQAIPVLQTTSPNGISGTWNPLTVNTTQTGTYTFTPNSGQCASAKSINVSVLYPIATIPPILQTCDNGNGFGTFSLSDNNPFINPNANGATLIDYYLTLAEAQSIFPQSSLSTIGFTNTVAYNQTIYAKVVDFSNALRPFSVVAVQLKVNPSLQPVATSASNVLNIYVDEYNILTLSTVFQGNVLYQWYEDGNPISGTSSSYTISNYTGINPRTFKVKVTKSSDNSCEGFSNNIIVGTIRVSAPSGNATQYYNAGQTLANLVVGGLNIRWYSSSIGVPTSLMPIGTLLTNNTTYYASQTIDGVESRNILAVTAILSNLANTDFNKIDFKFSPNPVVDFLNIQSKEIIKNISISNVLGQEVFNQNFNNLEMKVDLSNLVSGNYFMKVEADNKQQVLKIVKQ